MIAIYFAVGWALGCACMYVYFLLSGLMRTEEEYYAAKSFKKPPLSNNL